MYPGIHAAEHPDKPAVVMAGSGDVVTYRELDERSNRLAQLWWKQGLRPGGHGSRWLRGPDVAGPLRRSGGAVFIGPRGGP